MLLSLKWPSLEHQRLHARLMLLFKILTDKLIVPSCCLQSLTPVQSTRAYHQLKLAHIKTRIDIYWYSFLPRTINPWNNLQFPNIHDMDLTDFKNKLLLLLLPWFIYNNCLLACYPSWVLLINNNNNNMDSLPEVLKFVHGTIRITKLPHWWLYQ